MRYRNGEVANPEGLQVRFADRTGRIENSSGAPLMNVMCINDGKTMLKDCYTEQYGTYGVVFKF